MTDFTPSRVRFALWDKREQKIGTVANPAFYALTPNGEVLYNRGGFEWLSVASNYIPLPSTGLTAKTKDGTEREIVEGDIVRAIDRDFLVLYDQDEMQFIAVNIYNPLADRWDLKALWLKTLPHTVTILCHALSDEGKAMMDGEKKGRET